MFPTPLEQLLYKHEGKRNRIYRDSLGILSIGVGRNLETVGLRDDEIQLMLQNDIEYVREELEKIIPSFITLSPSRQAALIDMGFMGPRKLLEFTEMLTAIAAGDWNEAAVQVLKSRWASQVGQRAKDVAQIMVSDRIEV